MFPQFFPPNLVIAVQSWTELKRWERRELGQQLRRCGLSYREIARLIPVSKGTLSGWCRDLVLTDTQTTRLRSIRPRQAQRNGVGNTLHRRALERGQAIRDQAVEEARELGDDPFWVAGVVAYWSEGSKRQKDVVFANSDPLLVRLFIDWARRYLKLEPDRFTAKLHLHAGQNEEERREFWSAVTCIPTSEFRKTFIKPEGTGHRKNVLYNGTIQVRVTRSTDLLHRVNGWIEAVADDALERR